MGRVTGELCHLKIQIGKIKETLEMLKESIPGLAMDIPDVCDDLLEMECDYNELIADCKTRINILSALMEVERLTDVLGGVLKGIESDLAWVIHFKEEIFSGVIRTSFEFTPKIH